MKHQLLFLYLFPLVNSADSNLLNRTSEISQPNFLHSTQQIIFEQHYFSTQLKSPKENDVFINNCVFDSIASDGEGGALYFNFPDFSFHLSNSGFSSCHSKQTGGAVFFAGCKFNITKSCFQNCSSLQSGQVLMMTGLRDSHCLIDFSTVIYCGNEIGAINSHVIFISNVDVEIGRINQTDNKVIDIAAALCIAYSKGLSIYFSTFASSAGTNLFWLHRLGIGDKFQQCNIIDNRASSLFVLEECVSIFSELILLRNQISAAYFVSGTVQLLSCSIDQPFSPELFQNCQYKIDNQCHFNHSATIIPLHQIMVQAETWKCFRLGNFSETPTQRLAAFSYYPARMEEHDTQGVLLLVTLIGVGLIAGTLSYSFVITSKQKEQESMNLIHLSPCETNS